MAGGWLLACVCHQVPLWIGSKPRLVVVNRQDMIARADRAAWDKHFTAEAAAAQAAAAAKAAAKRKVAAARAGTAASLGAEGKQQQQQHESEQQQQQQQQQQEAEDAGPPPLPQQVFWTDGKTGSGVHSLRRAALKLSDHINAKRAKRGLAPRPVRACVIGFPNIGKSALINRLLGRRVVESAARPGVTRVLRCGAWLAGCMAGWAAAALLDLADELLQ
jgi:ribosome biogenesis GTPase A